MSKFSQSVAGVIMVAVIGGAGLAQRPRTKTAHANTSPTSMPAPPAAPTTVKAKYEGGVFGYPNKKDGTLNFDDTNQRLVFRDAQGKELFPIPYKAVSGAYGDTHSVRPAAA